MGPKIHELIWPSQHKLAQRSQHFSQAHQNQKDLFQVWKQVHQLPNFDKIILPYSQNQSTVDKLQDAGHSVSCIYRNDLQFHSLSKVKFRDPLTISRLLAS